MRASTLAGVALITTAPQSWLAEPDPFQRQERQSCSGASSSGSARPIPSRRVARPSGPGGIRAVPIHAVRLQTGSCDRWAYDLVVPFVVRPAVIKDLEYTALSWHCSPNCVPFSQNFHFGRPGRHRCTPSGLPRGPDVFMAPASSSRTAMLAQTASRRSPLGGTRRLRAGR